MRMTTRVDLAMRALMFCAANPGLTVRRRDIAAACQVSENHLAQVIHVLGLEGFLATQRGRAGGLRLARSPVSITVGAVFRALEADIPLTDCFAGGQTDCPLRGFCRLHCLLTQALAAFYAKLDEVTLAELVDDNERLLNLFQAA